MKPCVTRAASPGAGPAETARQLQQAIPHAELRALEGQDHNVSPAALAPLLLEFLT